VCVYKTRALKVMDGWMDERRERERALRLLGYKTLNYFFSSVLKEKKKEKSR